MENTIKKELCSGCMACQNMCPKKAIKIEYERDGFAYPKIDNSKCIDCKLCQKVCPILNKLEENTSEIEVYACKNKNEEVRMNSSSGGVFTLIAEWILNKQGVVFGVKFDENMQAVHDYIEKVEDLEEFRGSKYIQSKIGNTYQKAKEFLEKRRKVLFTGTPCQIEGLLAYLGKEYDNLYTQDIICHGVPSPKVWKKYLEYKKMQTGEYPKNVSFRKKDILGWRNYQIHYKYSNLVENVHHSQDTYMKFFLSNLTLRSSCYNCQFKKIKRKSDITVADFWGINNIKPEFYDEKGVSAVLVNSQKGKEVFDVIKDNMTYTKSNIEQVMKGNPVISKSVEYNEKREEFFEDLQKVGFDNLIKKYLV